MDDQISSIEQINQIKTTGDAVSVVIVSSTLVGWLPSIAAGLTIVWTAIRIYETRTVQRWLGTIGAHFHH